jgi:hypothetical protein
LGWVGCLLAGRLVIVGLVRPKNEPKCGVSWGEQ